MRQIYAEEMKKLQIEILDSVVKFCDENDIHYFLNGGTLLGAVRHKGYIPWDDDIDLGMLRPDYDKFIELFNNSSSRYKIHCIENDPEYIYNSARVFDERTELYEPDRKTGSRTAVSIDIFVMDNAPDDDAALKRMFTRQFIFRNLNLGRVLPVFMPPNGRNIFKRLLTYAVRIFMNMIPVFIIPKNYIAVKAIENAKKYVSEHTRRVGDFSGGHFIAIDREQLAGFTYGEFEGKQYKIPIGYDEWLTKLYGDYMKLPPKKWQITHHYYEAYLKEDGDE